MRPPTFLPGRRAEDDGVVEFQSLHQQRAANTTIDMIAAMVFSLSNLLRVKRLKAGAVLEMAFQNAFKCAEGFTKLARFFQNIGYVV